MKHYLRGLNANISTMIRPAQETDFQFIYEVINDSAKAYKGLIPADHWQVPYMSWEELQRQIQEGVQFWCYERKNAIIGCMGIQSKPGVKLIRHAYVRSQFRNHGIGSQLLSHLCNSTELPILVGTWAAATWAIQFYERQGFTLIAPHQKNKLLRKFWKITESQSQASVVLALRFPR